MVKGEFKCLGSVQHLKNKFSKGYTLKIKLKKNPLMCQSIEADNDCLNIKQYIEKRFTGSILRWFLLETFLCLILKPLTYSEEHSDMLTYHLPQTTLKWSELFELMEHAKDKFDIEDYSLGQTSLEQIFLYFARSQNVTDNELLESSKLTTRL